MQAGSSNLQLVVLLWYEYIVEINYYSTLPYPQQPQGSLLLPCHSTRPTAYADCFKVWCCMPSVLQDHICWEINSVAHRLIDMLRYICSLKELDLDPYGRWPSRTSPMGYTVRNKEELELQGLLPLRWTSWTGSYLIVIL
jgi:hypothetical protein